MCYRESKGAKYKSTAVPQYRPRNTFKNAILWNAGFSIRSYTRKDIMRTHYFWVPVAVYRVTGENSAGHIGIGYNELALYWASSPEPAVCTACTLGLRCASTA